MNEFGDFDENSLLALVAILPLMGIWGCSMVALDHWVWAAAPAPPPERRSIREG